MLVLEIEYLTGSCFAALGPDSEQPDWPPQPDRVFSALTATWAAHGHEPLEVNALTWLEGLSAPELVASEAATRSAATVFVPPNDPRSDRQKTAKGVVPSLRARQPRRFPAVRPHDPVVRLVWPDAEPDDSTFSALTSLARDTAYVGHSASLTRCRFTREPATHVSRTSVPLRWVYPGRFAELRREFEAGRRPQPGTRLTPPRTPSPKRSGVFDERWLLLEHVAGDMPDIRASALVSKGIRTALMSGYAQCGWADAIPEVVSGHNTSGEVSQCPHLAIVPLAFAGFPRADGRVLGFAVVPPRGSGLLDDDKFMRVLRELMPLDTELKRRVLTVTTRTATSSEHAFSLGLTPVLEPSRRSLDPEIYTRKAHCFASVTPIVLDRHLKERGDARNEEVAAQISAACSHIGLPPPSNVLAGKHSAIDGTASAYPSGNSPRWMRWRVPDPLASRQLTHAVIQFAEPVYGPVLLGAGRYVGLGLCRPIDDEEGT